MKKALVISCFFEMTDTSRPYLAYKYLSEKVQTKIIYSKFSHTTKKYRIIEGEDLIGIKPKKYKKNISVNRVISHIDFSIKVKKIIKKENPDLIYVAIPPNILGYTVILLSHKMGIKTIVDIVDIWPEALPIPSPINMILNLTVGKLWKSLRSYCINRSDCIISESEYFKKKLKLNEDVNVIHLCKLENNIDISNRYKIIDKNYTKITIGYLGSMNSIYDFDSLIEICKKIKKYRDIKLVIIGDGERKEWLLDQLDKFDVEYEYFGKIFDEQEKYKILSKCDFGFNGYKDSTEVALSYKSIDYLSYGIPLINSAKGDTWELVKNENIGINYTSSDIDEIIEYIKNLNQKDIICMKESAFNIFVSKFSWSKYREEMDRILNILNDKIIER